MKHFLTNTYPSFKEKPDARCEIRTDNGDVSLSDDKACSECRNSFNRYPAGCNEEGLKIHTDNQLCILRFDKYIEQFYPANIPSNCDYLLFDNDEDIRKVAFCDLSCSTKENVEPNSGKYPEGKRTKCRTQMQISLTTLAEDSVLATRLYSIPNRIALFGWREYRPSTGTDSGRAADAMRMFGRTPSSEATILEYESMALTGNFRFIEVKYPAIYQWTEPEQDIATYTLD